MIFLTARCASGHYLRTTQPVRWRLQCSAIAARARWLSPDICTAGRRDTHSHAAAVPANHWP